MTRTSEPMRFPFLFGGTFIEGPPKAGARALSGRKFPFLFGGTFIEGVLPWRPVDEEIYISLPFRRDFH